MDAVHPWDLDCGNNAERTERCGNWGMPGHPYVWIDMNINSGGNNSSTCLHLITVLVVNKSGLDN